MKQLDDGVWEVTQEEFHENPGKIMGLPKVVVVDDLGKVVMYICTQDDRLECTENEDLHQAAIAWCKLDPHERITAKTVLLTQSGKWVDVVLAFLRAADAT